MNKWKRISREGPPNKGEDVLVYCEDTEEQFVAFFVSPSRYQFAQKGDVTFVCNPTHWKPLLCPPKDN